MLLAIPEVNRQEFFDKLLEGMLQEGLLEGKQPDYSKEIDDKFIQTLTEEQKATFNTELTALRDKATKDHMEQEDFDKEIETLSAKYSKEQ